jgi:DNA-binding CsgD family transcriptional regulator
MSYEFIARHNAARRNRKNAAARSKEILRLAASGIDKQEIAKRLCLHPATVGKVLRSNEIRMA